MIRWDFSDDLLGKHIARIDFWFALEEYAPHAIKELCDKPLTAFQKSNTDWFYYNTWWDSMKRLVLKLEAEHGVPFEQIEGDFFCLHNRSQLLFYLALEVWLNRFNLNSKWLIKHLFWCLDFWVQCPQLKGKDLMNGFSAGIPWTPVLHEETKLFSFSHYGWRINMGQTSKDFKEQITNAFKKELDAYIEKMTELASKAGLKRVDTLHKSSEHAKWFVLYQVCELDYGQVIEKVQSENGIDESTMRKAIKKFANFIEIDLR